MSPKAVSRPPRTLMAAATRADLLKRLARIRGQVDGLRRMIEQGRGCREILQQSLSVRAALRSAEIVLLRERLRRCAADVARGDDDEAPRALYELVEVAARGLR